ncbi:MAG: putative endonuclease [Bacteroidia bacterium]|jgi:putative endonuclease
MFTLYVLRSEVDGRLNKGFTKDLSIRIAQHNNGKTKSTKGYMPWKVVYSEILSTLEEALLREKFLKTVQGRHFLIKTNS